MQIDFELSVFRSDTHTLVRSRRAAGTYCANSAQLNFTNLTAKQTIVGCCGEFDSVGGWYEKCVAIC